MKKIATKMITLVCAFLLFAVAVMPVFAKTETAQADTLTPIDVYLIAGQSNAAGYSNKDVRGEFSNQTYENIMYVGETEVEKEKGLATGFSNIDFSSAPNKRPSENTDFVWSPYVNSGLGTSNVNIGPEYGMAKVLNPSYSSTNKAIIFKTASGGTSLRDINTGLSNSFGNWYPRSLWTEGFTPNGSTRPTGVLYWRFVENFRNFYNELVSNGYKPVVKGMAWMQGEEDLGNHVLYEKYIEAFINDIREDLTSITGDLTLNAMPFVLGEIATTFSTYNNPSVPPFIEMQRAVAAKMNNVYTIATSDLIIVGQGEDPNNASSCTGTDRYHFNKPDAEELGVRFANKIIEASTMVVPSINVNDNKMGSVTYVKDSNDKITLTITVNTENENKKYIVSRVEVEGVDVTSSVTNGVYEFTPTGTRPTINVTFAEYDNYTITYDFDESKCGIITKPVSVYKGDGFEFKVATAKGYDVKEVKVNGVVVSATSRNKNDKNKTATVTYFVDNVTENVAVEIVTKKWGEVDVAVPMPGGCASAVSSVLAIIGALVAVAFVIKK